MTDLPAIFIGKGELDCVLYPKLANRHGLIAGATGTGKTVTLQILTEGFSAAGVPVFLADVKGDLSGLSQAGTLHPKFIARAQKIGLDPYTAAACPTLFWDLFGEQGHPIRTTISDMGPLLLARLLELNDTQEGVLNIVFKLADDQGLLLLDLKDLRAVLQYVIENGKQVSTQYGNVAATSVAAIQRRLLVLEQQGADHFFGEPALALQDLMRCDFSGHGAVSILAANKLMQSPKVYATFLVWLLAELFEELEEVGDLDKPKLVFFFDEAHLLFQDAPKAFIEKVEQVVRLIRSKGVGIYFVTQNPLDIPDSILGQLGNRVQHALRAYTPRDQKAVRAAAETFRPNPAIDVAQSISELGVGEALVSTLDPGGIPTMVQRALIRPPSSRMGPANDSERQAVMNRSPVGSRYDTAVDRESAHERLAQRAEAKAAEEATEEAQSTAKSQSSTPKSGSNRQTVMEAMVKSLARTVGTGLGRQIVRGVLGSILKSR